MSDDELICSVPRSRGAVQVRDKIWKGNRRADLREWYLHPETGELCPGKGVAIRANEIRAVIAALTKLADAFDAEAAG